ncbi:MAG: hypothetical protein QNK63_10985 [Flavobacteriales bacterium]|jgi:hypothetical protein|tara:strand:+ start:518 stop:1399 length:882 start_codon:yes stop_codon:yes gene_type:complete
MNNKVYIGLIVLLGLLCAYLGYKVSSKQTEIIEKTTEVDDLTTDRARVQLELEKMKFSYDTLITDNEQLSAEMFAQKEQIETLLKRVKNTNYDLYKVKKEAETLRGIMKGYVYQIDSLNVLSRAQAEEISGLRTDLGNEREKRNALNSEKEQLEGKLEVGAILAAGDISSKAVRLKSSGKQVETDRASKAELIKTCFSLRKNLISPSEDKFLYLRIQAPDGTILNPNGSEASRIFDGQLGPYSIRRVVNYSKEEMDVCVFYNVPNPEYMAKGDYTIYIYEQEHKIGQTSLSLR